MDLPTEPLSEEEHKEFLEDYWKLMTLNFTRTARPAVEGFYKKVTEIEVKLNKKKTRMQELDKAAVAKVEKASKAQAELESKAELDAEQQRHNYREQLIVKQQQIDDDKEKLRKLRKKQEEETEKFNVKKEKAKQIVLALKAVNKMYSSNLCMSMDIDESTGLITLTFQIPDSNNKYVDYKITLRQKGQDEYVVVKPSKDIKPFSDELEKSNNVAKFLCQVREHAVSLIRHE